MNKKLQHSRFFRRIVLGDDTDCNDNYYHCHKNLTSQYSANEETLIPQFIKGLAIEKS